MSGLLLEAAQSRAQRVSPELGIGHGAGALTSFNVSERRLPEVGHRHGTKACPRWTQKQNYDDELDSVENDQISARALEPETNYLLVVGRPVPTFSGLSRRKLNDDGARMLPMAFQHRQVAATSYELTAEGSERARDELAIFCKHRFVMHCLYSYYICFHPTPPDPASI
jgi:hypothetical protein